jgi:hypothetical protein
MRKIIAALVLAIALVLVGGTGVAIGDPNFGPGNNGGGEGNENPQDNGAKCHPPGQTVEVPGCK